MLETSKKGQLQKLANARGKSVEYVNLQDIRPFSLISITTESGNVYVIETLNTREGNGLDINIGNALMNHVSPAQVKDTALRLQKPLEYVSKGLTFTTKPLKNIQLLVV